MAKITRPKFDISVNPVLGTVPMEITMLEWPLAAWRSAAVLWLFGILYAVAAGKCFFTFNMYFCNGFCTFWCKKQAGSV